MDESELSEDAKDVIDAWHEHPLTVQTRGGFLKEAETALLKLFGAARTSTDPNVRGRMAEYETLRKAAATLTQDKQ